MIVVNIIGGLGNQMFQFAFGFAVAKENNTEIKLDLNGFSEYDLRDYELDLFNIEKNLELQSKYDFIYKKLNGNCSNIFSRIIRKILRYILGHTKFYYQEKEAFVFDNNVFKISVDTYFYGYWQNEKYFNKYRKELVDIFSLKNIHTKTLEYKKKIFKCESVSLHIRRGDYLTDNLTNRVHGICDIKYYKNAVIEFIKNKKHVHFFIFSDDLDWAKSNLDFIENKTFVNLGLDIPDHEEMHLMSQCKHNIIANSSFSWWGAWLNQNEDKKVIAPKKWLKISSLNAHNIIPESWVRL